MAILPSLERERALALSVLQDLGDSLVNRMLEHIQERLDADTFTQLQGMIHFDQFKNKI